MNQQMVIEMRSDSKQQFQVVSRSFNPDPKLHSKVIPYMAVYYMEQGGVAMQATLSVANPDTEIAQNIFGKEFRISIGYSGFINGVFKQMINPIFIGKCFQAPVFQEFDSTDQILIIPLSYTLSVNGYGGFTTNDTISTALSKLFPKTKINYNPMTIATQYLQKPLAIKDKTNFKTIQKYFSDNEKIFLKQNPTDSSISVTLKSSGGLVSNAGLIFNNEKETSIKTKYAAIDASGALNIELAFVLPNLIGKNYATIENIGKNINIYNTNRGKFNSTFFIQRQEINFSTWGDNIHNLALLSEWQK